MNIVFYIITGLVCPFIKFEITYKTKRHVLTKREHALNLKLMTLHKYWLVYHINGVMAIVLEWLKWDCKEPVEDVVEIIENCVRTKNAAGIEEPSI